MKGFAEPVRAWRLTGLHVAAERLAIVGRAGELARFAAVLAECSSGGSGRAIHIRGEAGMGRDAVEEFQRAAGASGFASTPDGSWISGTGTQVDAIRSLVHGMLGPEDHLDADDAVFLNDLLGLPQPAPLRALYDAMDHSARDSGRRRALARLVERASGPRPQMLVAEDLHWADRPTLALMAEIARTRHAAAQSWSRRRAARGTRWARNGGRRSWPTGC